MCIIWSKICSFKLTVQANLEPPGCYLLDSYGLFLLFSDFDQLPHNVPISATIADTEEKKGFIDYFVCKIGKYIFANFTF